MSGEHQQPGRDQVLTPSSGIGEPPAGYDPGAFDADVIAALCHLAEVINQQLQSSISSPAAITSAFSSRPRAAPESRSGCLAVSNASPSSADDVIWSLADMPQVGTWPTRERAICESSTARPTQRKE